jgi:hypothetical protein
MNIDSLIAKLEGFMKAAQAQYAVNPVVFVVLLTACAPFFYFSIYKLVRALAKRDSNRIMVWSAVFLGATILPYLYVLFFGRNMPWWIYLVLVVLIAQGIYSLVRKLRGGKKRSADKGAPPGSA